VYRITPAVANPLLDHNLMFGIKASTGCPSRNLSNSMARSRIRPSVISCRGELVCPIFCTSEIVSVAQRWQKTITRFIGNSKGEEGHPDLKGVGSPLASKWYGDETVKTLQKSSIEVLPVANLQQSLSKWTHEVIENTPYNDSLLSEARPPKEPTILPREVGVETPIKHVIYIIKENRTYDQEFGDIKGTNSDSRLTIFGEEVTPNQHAPARQYVVLDNLYCDGEVSVDGHS
jgi:hypothetical protein